MKCTDTLHSTTQHDAVEKVCKLFEVSWISMFNLLIKCDLILIINTALLLLSLLSLLLAHSTGWRRLTLQFIKWYSLFL